jgi:hypothetical protein
MSRNIYLPGDRILHDGHPAVVICGHADGQRLYIRTENGGDDLLVDAATCAPVALED